MTTKQRLVFRLQVLVVPEVMTVKNLRVLELMNHEDRDIKDFLAMEPDGDYRLGNVLTDMLDKAKKIINETEATPMKVCFVDFGVADGGATTGIDLG